ncbi:ankyrin repeat-containing domain protein [Coprinopsis sp. MPI-PUGE-AT-0042]|nr:ankyrin repeat-containing domain protein [Coprinopsis sp. MPI-PUGE-AT-0042]
MSEVFGPSACTIPANPDIAGVGVRTAIYTQNLLSLLSAIWALWDGKVTRGKLDYAEMQTTTNLILAFAILISSIVQARTLGISNYHANIVLMMSWMNNTNTFVYFILYLHYKLQGEGGRGVTGKEWVKHMRSYYFSTLSDFDGRDAETGTVLNDGATHSDRKGHQGAKILIKRFVLVLGSLHLTLMATLGIWLWSDIRVFGLGRKTPGDFTAANECAVDRAAVAILGQGVPLSSPILQVFSIAVYTLLIAPGVNLVPPMILFLVTYFGCRRFSFAKRWEVLPAYIGLGILLTINLVFIVDIELTRDLNRGIQGKDEADWGFGQILAMLLLLLPLRDLTEAILARRLKQRQKELEEDLQEAIVKEEFQGIKRAIERGSAFPSPKSPGHHFRFWNVICAHRELDYFDNLRRKRMTIAEKALEGDLHSAIEEKSGLGIDAAYNQGADLIGGALQSAEAAGLVLWYALNRGHHHIVYFHARRLGRHVNERGPSGEIPLVFASEKGDEPLAWLLLQNPAIDTNVRDRRGRTALLAAAKHGREAIVKVLLNRPDIQPNAADKADRTALIWASQAGHEGIVKLLLAQPDIQPNAADKDGRVALFWAMRKGHKGIAKMLLDRSDTQPNVGDKYHWTPLICASRRGTEVSVKLLLERPDTLPNASDKDGWTALIWASLKGYEGIVKMLLERNDIQADAADAYGRTPLIWASRNGQAGVVNMLLTRPDIDLHAANRDGSTALDLALGNGHDIVAEMILARSRQLRELALRKQGVKRLDPRETHKDQDSRGTEKRTV